MRIGWITKSFGRLVDLYAASLVLVNNKDTFPDDYFRLRNTRWIFPEKQMFPFLDSELRKLIHILKTTNLKPYKLVTKGRKHRNFLSSSQDDFIKYSHMGYGKPLLRTVLPANYLRSEVLDEKIKRLKNGTRGVVGFYARDDHWDTTIGHTKIYLEANHHRNPQESHIIACVESLLDLGFAVVRLGRSSKKILDSSRNNFFDYASESALWADNNDFLLWREIDFGFSTNGGAMTPCLFFGKPLMLWDFNEHLGGISDKIPNYPEGHVIVIPRTNSRGVNLSARINDREFLERACSTLITGSKEMTGSTRINNILICEDVKAK